MQDKLSPQRDDQKMTAIAPNDARRFVRSQLEEIAVTRKPGESIKAMLVRVARIAGLDFSRTRKLWYQEVDNIPWHEVETLRLRAQEQRQLWRDMQRRQDLATLETSIRRTRENVAEIRRRASDRPPSAVDLDDAGRQRSFSFWLGREAPGLD